MQYRIEICGGIASGKTTLASLFPDDCFLTIFEEFQDNPFLEAFYENPNRFSFETEITFLLQHYHQIIASKTDDKIIITDYSFVLDRAYGDVTLDEITKRTFLAVYNEVMRRLPLPSLLVHLTCSASIELARIRERGRSIENAIDESYLSSLNQAVSRHVEPYSRNTKVLRIDSAAYDFAHDLQEKTRILADVEKRLDLPKFFNS